MGNGELAMENNPVVNGDIPTRQAVYVLEVTNYPSPFGPATVRSRKIKGKIKKKINKE